MYFCKANLYKYEKGFFNITAIIFDLNATFGRSNIDVVQPSDGIVIVGVCTDICVISNALILRAKYPNLPITIYADATAGTTPDNHRAALAVAAANCIDVKNWEDEK